MFILSVEADSVDDETAECVTACDSMLDQLALDHNGRRMLLRRLFNLKAPCVWTIQKCPEFFSEISGFIGFACLALALLRVRFQFRIRRLINATENSLCPNKDFSNFIVTDKSQLHQIIEEHMQRSLFY